jgi:uncharacterized membrane protein
MSPLHSLQVWLVGVLGQDTPVADLMRTAWAWPIVESLHFLGLCILIGTVGTFDLRLLGLGKRVPIAAVHRLIPYGLIGFALNVTTGLMFVMTEPDQYIYNSSFHLKLLFLAVAGLNAGTFYLTTYRQAFGAGAVLDAPRHAKVIAAISLAMWVGIILCGRMITFFRPGPCFEELGLLLNCHP